RVLLSEGGTAGLCGGDGGWRVEGAPRRALSQRRCRGRGDRHRDRHVLRLGVQEARLTRGWSAGSEASDRSEIHRTESTKLIQAVAMRIPATASLGQWVPV